MAQFSRFFHKFAINRKFLFYKLESFGEYFFLNRGVLESFGEFFFKLESFREFFTNSRLIANFFSFFLIAKTLENTSGESPRLPGISMYVFFGFFFFGKDFTVGGPTGPESGRLGPTRADSGRLGPSFFFDSGRLFF